MTEENQMRRDFLTEIETIIHETLASQSDDCTWNTRVLDRGIVRIDEVVRKYKAEWNWVEPSGKPPVADTRRTPSWMLSGRHG